MANNYKVLIKQQVFGATMYGMGTSSSNYRYDLVVWADGTTTAFHAGTSQAVIENQHTRLRGALYGMGIKIGPKRAKSHE